MNTSVIWDLDGTLLDSYPVIVESLFLALHLYDDQLSREYIWQYVIDQSSNALIQKISEERCVSTEQILDRYLRFSEKRYRQIKSMVHAREILDALSTSGVKSYVYTHRGSSTIPVLKNLGMEHCFQEILTSKCGFPRKPAPDAISFLIGKHAMNPEKTFYVGDRSLDMDCARNAGIQGILFLPENGRGTPTGAQDYIVEDLLDILPIVI